MDYQRRSNNVDRVVFTDYVQLARPIICNAGFSINNGYIAWPTEIEIWQKGLLFENKNKGHDRMSPVKHAADSTSVRVGMIAHNTILKACKISIIDL